MITIEELEKLIYEDKERRIPRSNWFAPFHDLWKERYLVLNTVRDPETTIDLNEKVVMDLVRDFHFDEIHLFKIYKDANVFALLTDNGDGFWTYEFIILHKDDQDNFISGINTVDAVKKHFNDEDPVLEIPLPFARKYVED